ncbi:MAG: hypothetical protein R2715_07480 [Ilumatobacteraceae bacterium]
MHRGFVGLAAGPEPHGGRRVVEEDRRLEVIGRGFQGCEDEVDSFDVELDDVGARRHRHVVDRGVEAGAAHHVRRPPMDHRLVSEEVPDRPTGTRGDRSVEARGDGVGGEAGSVVPHRSDVSSAIE